jgi:hypothetical protein
MVKTRGSKMANGLLNFFLLKKFVAGSRIFANRMEKRKGTIITFP